MSPDGKFFPGNTENSRQPIEMKLCEKLKIFSQLFTAFLKATFNFKHFQEKGETHTLCLSKIIDCQITAYVNV